MSPSSSICATQSWLAVVQLHRAPVIPCTGPSHVLAPLQLLPLSQAWLRCRVSAQPLSHCPARPLSCRAQHSGSVGLSVPVFCLTSTSSIGLWATGAQRPCSELHFQHLAAAPQGTVQGTKGCCGITSSAESGPACWGSWFVMGFFGSDLSLGSSTNKSA